MISWTTIKRRITRRVPTPPLRARPAHAQDEATAPGASAPRRVLVVVDRALADVASLPAPVLLAEREADEVYVVAPVLTNRREWLTSDSDRATAEAEDRLAIVLDRMRLEQRVVASGRVGDESPVTSIDDALMDFAADEIIIVRSDDHGHWHERGLADKVRRRYAQPLIQVVVHADGSSSLR
jgi:hypothetical protein